MFPERSVYSLTFLFHLVVAHESPHTGADTDGCHLGLILQYIYETNENGDKVVLGKGTYGVVYAGRDLSNQVRIAIKEIPEKDSTYEKHTFYTVQLRVILHHINI